LSNKDARWVEAVANLAEAFARSALAGDPYIALITDRPEVIPYYDAEQLRPLTA
jgi:hypothetical protein